MDALEILAIEAERFRLRVLDARWMRDRMVASGADEATLAGANMLLASAENAYEPYRLHVECETATRAIAHKQAELDELRARPTPLSAEDQVELRIRIERAEAVVVSATAEAKRLADLIAEHPAAKEFAFNTSDVSVLTIMGPPVDAKPEGGPILDAKAEPAAEADAKADG